MKEEEIIKKAKKGDKEAFSLLYKKYGKKIFQFIYWRTENKEVSKDLLQEVFLKAWKNIAFYQEKNFSIRAWLYKIARNTVIDYYRTKRPEISLEEKIEIVQAGSDIVKKAKISLEKERLKKAINLLPEVQKEVIILKFIEELSNKEISKILKKSETAIRIIQYRALKKLREILKENEFF